MSEREITVEMPAPTQPTGPTEHLSDPEYWRGLYTDAIEVGKEMMADRADLRARITALEAENERLRTALTECREEAREAIDNPRPRFRENETHSFGNLIHVRRICDSALDPS